MNLMKTCNYYFSTVSLCILLLSTIEGQSVFKSGYIVTLSNDTIRGQIEVLQLYDFSKKITFRKSAGTVSIYHVDDIEGFGISGGRRFTRFRIGDNTLFLNILFESKVSLYSYKNQEGVFKFFINKQGLGLREIKYSERIERSTSTVYVNYKLRKSTEHFGILSSYMADGPNTLKKIKTIEKPGENNLIKLFEFYHNEVCPDEKCYVFIDPTPKSRTIIEPAVILMKHGIDAPRNHDNPVIHFGGNIYLQFPRVNDHIGMRIGMAVGVRDFVNSRNQPESVIFTRVNVHAMYIYPKGWFRPKGSLGLDLQRPTQLGLGGMLGANIQISKKSTISLNYDHFLFGLFSKSEVTASGTIIETLLFNPKSLSIGFAYDVSKE